MATSPLTRAGELRHRVILQRPAGGRDAVGERITTWSNVATVYAAIEPLSSGERFVAAQEHAEMTHTVTVRYSSDIAAIDASWRVLFGARVLVLNGTPINVDERNITFELPCIEGVRQE